MPNTITDEKLAEMLRKVQALLANADSYEETNPATAANYRERAEIIMRKYRIEEEELRQTKIASGTAAKPVVMNFPFAESHSKYVTQYYWLMLQAMNHVGVKGDYHWDYVVDEETGRRTHSCVMTMVGFDSDVQVAQLLYTNMRLTFAEKLEPKVDRSLSDADNVYRLRSAGLERPRIGEIMGWGSQAAQKVTKVYIQACKERGEDPKVVGKRLNAKTYRESYADGFVAEIRARLRRMRATAAESTALVLAGRNEAVEEAFYEQFPHLRPKPAVAGSTTCAKCRKAASGYCRDHKPRAYKPRPFSQQGWAAGSEAARDADLSRVAPSTKGKLQ